MQIYEFLVKFESASVKDVVNQVHLTQPTVSYHLHDMQKNGLLTSKKQGKEVIYMVNPLCPVYKDNCVLQNIKFPEGSTK
jgi:predicted transcriptional regulator